MLHHQYIPALLLVLTAFGLAGEKDTVPVPPASTSRPTDATKSSPSPYFPNRTDVSLEAAKDPSYQPPRVLDRTPPKVPSELRGHYQLTVAFIIEADGKVRDAMISSSSGSNPLDRANIEMVKKWKFKPARVAGKAIPNLSMQQMNFDLP
jgi:TonB family protein